MSKLQTMLRLGKPLVKKAEEEEFNPAEARAHLGNAIRRGTETRLAVKNPLSYLAARAFLGPEPSVIKMASQLPDTLEEVMEVIKEAARKGPGWDRGGGEAHAMTPGALGLSAGQSRMLGGPETFSSLAAATMRPGMYGGMYGGGGMGPGMNMMGPASVDNVISLYKGQASGQGGYGVGW